MSIYTNGTGDSLIDDERLPVLMRRYLAWERSHLRRLLKGHACLVEVGCMTGRHVLDASERGIQYIGIDVSLQYIKRARARWRGHKHTEFHCADAVDLREVLLSTELEEPALVFYPFNSIGNMECVDAALDAIHKASRTFLIGTYGTSKWATAKRIDYYRNCGFSRVRARRESDGIRCIDPSGLNSMAYFDVFFRRRLPDKAFQLRRLSRGRLGRLYVGRAR